MQIVIDIDENVFTRLFDNGTEDYEIATDDLSAIATFIRKGTPLPKGHGRLIDADEVDDAIYKCFDGIQFYDGTGYDIYLDSKESIDKIPTIIEADKGSEG